MKKLIITISVILICLLILFLPYHTATYKDGGTKVYSAVTYKIVKWHCLDSKYDSGYYENTSVYWFPDNFKSIDELWDIEMQDN